MRNIQSKNKWRTAGGKWQIQGAFTLIEILVSLTIIGILFSFGYASFRDFSRRQALAGIVKQVQGDLRLAQQMALSGQKPTICAANTLDGYNFVIDSALPPTYYAIQADCSVLPAQAEVKRVGLPTGITIAIANVALPGTIKFKVLGQGTNIDSTTPARVTISQVGAANSQTIQVTSSGEIKDPISSTSAPTVAPTAAPTVAPTVAPTAAPTVAPTAAPTSAPTTPPAPVFVGTGGTITYSGGYTIHTFTSSGTFTANIAGYIEILIVGGGGGGGAAYGGGGGAGALLYRSSSSVAAGSMYVEVGAGGAGAPAINAANVGSNGGNSYFGSGMGASGGGGGAGYLPQYGAGNAGGSGGGGVNLGIGGGSSAVGELLGSAGGSAAGAPNYGGGGGGGAGGMGGSGSGTAGGYGGAGLTYSISGSSVTYAGGGGGGTYKGGTGGAGGLGGGGAGGSGSGNNPGLSGSNGTGGGGGGSGFLNTTPAGGNGGSGVVIIRYPTN